MNDDTRMQFDIVLVKKPQGTLDAHLLGAPPLTPEVAAIVIYQLREALMPCLLPVALPKRLAWELMQRLRRLGARGDIVEVAYRTPRVSVEQAHRIAVQTLKRWLSGGVTYSYRPVQLTPSQSAGVMRWWRFFAPNPDAQAEGFAPGGASIYVDKLDGSVWTTEELELIAQEWEQLLYLFPGWRQRRV